MLKSILRTLLLCLVPVLFIASCSDDDDNGPSDPGGPDPVDVTLVASSRDGDIYTVNQSTGSETLFVETWMEVAAPRAPEAIGRISSMVYVPATSEWWLGAGGTALCDGCIFTLNPETGEGTVLSEPSGDHHGGGVSGLAIHPDNGRIFTFCADCGNDFFEINPNTGEWTQLPDAVGTGGNGNGSTFTNEGVLYTAADGHLYRVDHTDSSVTDVGACTYTGFPAFSGSNQPITGLTTRPSDGAVFGILVDGAGQGRPTASFLVRVNVETAEVTNVGQNTNLLAGIAFVPTSLID